MNREYLLPLMSLLWATLTHGQTETGPEVARVNGTAAEDNEPQRTKSGIHLLLVENHSPLQDVEREQALPRAWVYLSGQAQAPTQKNALAQLRRVSHVERIENP